jgi:hypothetical protein
MKAVIDRAPRLLLRPEIPYQLLRIKPLAGGFDETHDYTAECFVADARKRSQQRTSLGACDKLHDGFRR